MDLDRHAGITIRAQVHTPSQMCVSSIQLAPGVHPVHSHERPNIYFLLSGRLDDITDVTREVLGSGDLLFLPAGVPHWTVLRRAATAVVIDLPQELVRQFCGLYGGRTGNIRISALELQDLPRRLVSELARADRAAPFIIDGIVRQILAQGCRVVGSCSRVARPQWLDHAIAYIESNTDHAVSSRELSENLHVSQRRIRDAFRQHVGRKVIDVSREARVRLATKLLQRDASISDIAAQLGFYDQSHLTRIFRRVAMTTPNTLRLQQKNGSDEDKP